MLGRRETSRAFFTHSAKPSFYTLLRCGREWCVAASRQCGVVVPCTKCGDKNVESSKQMHMTPFSSQRIAQDSIMSGKKELLALLISAFKSLHPILKTLPRAQYSVLNHLIKRSQPQPQHTPAHPHNISCFFIFSLSFHLSHEHTHVCPLIKSQITLE